MAVKLVAHRGESEIAPENTLEAFQLAWELGAEAVEGDFHLSGDGEVVCIHDGNTRRTCGVEAEVGKLTLAELKSLDAGRWKGGRWEGVRIPTLAEILAALPDYGEIYIELKGIGPIVDAIRRVFAAASRRSEQLTFIAFDAATAAAVKPLFPGHRSYWLLNNAVGGERRFRPRELAERLCELGVDGVDIAYGDDLDASFVDAVHQAGKSFHVWTVNDAVRARRLIELGVDSITTDRRAALAGELRVSAL